MLVWMTISNFSSGTDFALLQGNEQHTRTAATGGEVTHSFSLTQDTVIYGQLWVNSGSITFAPDDYIHHTFTKISG